MTWLRRFWPLLRPLAHLSFRLRRGMTLGVRGLVRDADGRILLVSHSYMPGWHLPGGGVEAGEAAEAALARELVEEGGVRLTGPARLVSISASTDFRGDHVLLYEAGGWEPCAATARGEIDQRGWFGPDDLPDGVTLRNRAWIAEVLKI